MTEAEENVEELPFSVKEIKKKIDARIELEDFAEKLATLEENQRKLSDQLAEYKNLPVGQLHILDSAYINKLTEAVMSISESYRELAKEAIAQLSNAKTDDAASFRKAANTLIVAANALADTFKVALTEIKNALLYNATLEKEVLMDIKTKLKRKR